MTKKARAVMMKSLLTVTVAIGMSLLVAPTSPVLAKAPCLARPSMSATMCERPPVIDGRLDDEAWKQASRSRFTKQPGDLPNHVRTCWDGRMLYVAVSCQEPHMATVERSTQRENATLTDGPYTSWNPRTWPGHNGAAQLFYPGQDGPVTSLRMESWLDGMEDYEYLTLAKKRIEELRAAGQKRKADKLEESLAPYVRTNNELFRGLTDYTRDPTVIETARLRLAQALLDARDD